MKSRMISLLLLILVIFGCIDQPQPLPNIVNGSEPGWSEYSGFVSFEFPSDMSVVHKVDRYDSGRGVASVSGAERQCSVSGAQCPETGNGKPATGNGQPNTLFALLYANSNQYGAVSPNHSFAVRDFLGSDSISDPAGLLINAKDVSEIKGYTHGEAYVAEVVFSLEVLSSGNKSKLSGYALNLYYPKKSALYRLRVISENASYATQIKERFMETFQN